MKFNAHTAKEPAAPVIDTHNIVYTTFHTSSSGVGIASILWVYEPSIKLIVWERYLILFIISN
jgi:hypothetical protein